MSNIAVIDYMEDFCCGAALDWCEAEIKHDYAKSIEQFEQRYGSLEKYSGVMIHFGVEKQKIEINTLERIAKENPHLKIAIGTNSASDYNFYPEDFAIIGWKNTEKIKEYFKI